MNCGIYSILNLENGKIYVGQSIDIFPRFKRHLYLLRNNKHPNNHLQKAFNKYGEKSFKFNILENCSKKQLNNNEQWWIKYFKSNLKENGYNNTSGGDSNYIFSEESRKKMSYAQKGEKHSMWGKRHTEESRKKMSESRTGEKNHMFGKKHSTESIKKISEAKQGIKHTLEQKVCISKSVNTTGYFRVRKQKSKTCKQGFTYQYRYYNEKNRRCVICRIDINDLKEEVLKRGLEWIEY